jgi:uncharacterized membrane protein
MKDRRALRRRARDALAGSWGAACAATLLLIAAVLLLVLLEWAAAAHWRIPFLIDAAHTPETSLDDVPNATAAALRCVSLFAGGAALLLTPLFFGLRRWCYCAACGDRRPVREVTAAFCSARLFGKTIAMTAALFWLRLFWAALFLALPTAALAIALPVRAAADGWLRLLCSAAMLCAAISAALLAVLWRWFCRRYALAWAALAENPDGTVRAAIRRSVCAMRGENQALGRLLLSLLPWRLTEGLVLPTLWVLPYRETVLALYARERFDNE